MNLLHARTGCEPNDNLLRQAERRLRADGLEATFTIQRAIDDLGIDRHKHEADR